MAPEVLRQVLAGLEVFQDPNVLVGYENADDAGVYRLDDETALVQTVDFFTPIVDDPFLYGQISAANALSDIYAMGGSPLCALSIVCFPKEKPGPEVLKEILRGGTSKMAEARVPVIGGHSVQDEEIKFGYSVTGRVHPGRVLGNGGARPGDALLLTKPLGTGIVSTGIKYGKSSAEVAGEAVRWMLRLNGEPMGLLSDVRVHAVTDVTGFGLLGHALEMAASSGVTLRLDAREIPILPGVEDLAARGMLPGGIESNEAYAGGEVRWEGDCRFFRKVLFDPQTSGGLLVALPPEDAVEVQKAFSSRDLMGCRIGEAVERQETLIEVRC